MRVYMSNGQPISKGNYLSTYSTCVLHSNVQVVHVLPRDSM